MPHEPRVVDSRFPHHALLKIRRGVGSLQQDTVVRKIQASFREGAERGTFRPVEYSLQPDHAHPIVEAENPDDLVSGLRSLAARLGRAVNRALRRSGPVLAERYRLAAVETPKDPKAALRSVLRGCALCSPKP